MQQMETVNILQLIAWIIALVEFVVGLYILLLNVRGKANRHVCFLLVLIAINTYAQGYLQTANSISQIQLPTIVLAATTPAIQPGLLLIAVVLLKPQWFEGKLKAFWWFVYAIIGLPIVLTLVDYYFGTAIWFTGYKVETYTGGFINLQYFTEGLLGVPIRIAFIYVITVVTIFPILYIAFFDKSVLRITRNLAFTLLFTQILAVITNFVLFYSGESYLSILATSSIFAVGYTYATFWQLISERRMQSGRIQIRLTAVILAITIPLMVALSIFVNQQAGGFIQQNAVQRLTDTNNSISSTVTTWLDLNERALDMLVKMPGIISMNPSQQKPILERMAGTYDYMYLISTLDLTGFNVARNDDVELKDYSDRFYYQSIMEGKPVAQQTLIGKTSGQPALVVAKPIKDNSGKLVGVGFYASTLEKISEAIKIGNIGATGIAFVVDENNQVIAHPDPQNITEELRDFSTHPAVASMRQGGSDNLVRFSDDQGIFHYATYQELDNGWGVIVQQSENDFLETLAAFQTLVPIIIIIGVLLLGALTALAIRQAVRPIEALTETATAITKGDLTRIAPIESDDEIGVLAQSFNRMTEQLLESITGLERRVAERTQELEKRSLQLQGAADVGRTASTELDIDKLILNVVEMIRSRFHLYYVGLFLVDEQREWANLRAGTGEAGKTMLARGHRIKIGQGMIGWTIANAKARIALEAGEDAIRLSTPELPETRSEAAIPLQTRGQVIGAITVQDSRPDSFDESSISTLQTMADLVSVAIDNARLFTESQQALETSRRAFLERISRTSREEFGRGIGYRSTKQGTYPYQNMDIGIHKEAISTEVKCLTVPIKIRDEIIGELETKKQGEWQPEELSMIETIVEQISIALESASLYQETQRRAGFEQLTREATSRMRQSLDLESVIQIAASEFRNALDLSEVEIRLGLADER